MLNWRGRSSYKILRMKKSGLKLFILLILFPLLYVHGQEVKPPEPVREEDEGVSLCFGADVMSRYIWRGMDFGNSPAIQPNLTLSWKGLNVGLWGSYAFTGHSIQVNDSVLTESGPYTETDFVISYTYRWFTLSLIDMFIPDGLSPNEGNDFFNYRNSTTGHTLEANLTFNGTERVPLQLMISTLFYGDDKNRDTTGVYGSGEKNNFSTYLELAYEFTIKKFDVTIRPFAGATPFGSSWYQPDGGIINAGFTARKEIPVTSGYCLPVQFSAIANPKAGNLFFVFGVSL